MKISKTDFLKQLLKFYSLFPMHNSLFQKD